LAGTAPPQIFLLSPAHCRGRRAGWLLRPDSDLPVAHDLRAGTLTLGRAFVFLSGLYFRGKLAYAERFGRPEGEGDDATYIITPTRGLLLPSSVCTIDLLLEFAAGEVDLECSAYRTALERDVTDLAGRLGDATRAVLLGSVAGGKYVDILAPILGSRLQYPSSFVGRGDMSRGGLLLRSAAAGEELEYEVLAAGVRPRGRRAPKLDPRTRVRPASGQT
jgi:hypothetical protein